jgi:chromosome segregation ATPase
MADSRSVMQGLIDATAARLQETEARLRDNAAGLASKETVAELQQQLTVALAHIEHDRAHVENLIQQLAGQCRQTEAGLTVVTESQAQSRAELEQKLLAELDGTGRKLMERIQQTATTLEALQDSQLKLKDGLDQELRAEVSRTRQDLDADLTQLREEFGTRLTGTADSLTELSEALTRMGSDWEADARAHAEVAGDQAIAIQDIYQCVGRHEDEIQKLSHEAATRFEALARGLSEVRQDVQETAQADQLRSEHEAFARNVLERFEQKASELDELKRSLDERLAQVGGDHESSIAEICRRLDGESRQLRHVRSRLVQSHAIMRKRIASLDEKYAARAEVDSLRQTQAAQAGEILEQIQANQQASQAEVEAIRQAQVAQASDVCERIRADRQAVESLINELADRFRATHQRLDALGAAAEADGADLADLRRVQAEDVASLLRQLEDQRCLSQAQFEQTLANWMQAQQEIAALREVAADESALEELRRCQDRHSEEILRMLGDQRQSLEALIGAANLRCDATMARLDALPANVASMNDVRTLHEETLSNKAALENAIHLVAEQCERTASDLRQLEDRAASVDMHLEQFRQDHAQDLDQIVQRLDGQSSEFQQEFDALKQRWAGLRSDLQNLAGATTPVEKFEAAERLINRDLDALKQRLEEVAVRRQKDAGILVNVVQRLSDRVKHLEEMDRPQPVRVEMHPRAAEELASLNTAAQSNAAELRKLLAECNAVDDRLRDTSAHVEQTLREWAGQAGCVQEQAEQLRASTASSGSILQALRKCHEAIDNKLKSPAWHGQLHRAEELTARLEQVLPNYQEFDETVQAWLEQRNQAGPLVQRLERLLAESARATARLGRVGALMAGVAAKGNIAEAIESARDHDEQLRPARGNGRKNGHRAQVQPVAWPKYRTHTQANAG